MVKLYSVKKPAFRILLIAIFLLSVVPGCNSKQNEEIFLLVYTPAGIREAMEEIAAAYEKQCQNEQVNIKFVFNSSGRLLTQMELNGEGDIFISSDDSFMEKALSKKLVKNPTIVARFVPAIVVKQGNPAAIYDLSDLTRPGLRVILADHSAAMGRAAEQILQEKGLYGEVLKNVITRVATAPQVVLSIAMGQGDAGITGVNSIGEMGNRVEIISIPSADNYLTNISFAVLDSSAWPGEAENFLKFMLSEQGQYIFKKNGLEPIK